MKRYSLIQARGAEFTSGTEGIAVEGEGNDAIELKVVRGKVSLIVPATLPDAKVNEETFKHHSYIDVELEDGTHVSGWMHGGEAHLEAEFSSRPRKRASEPAPAHRRGKPSLVEHETLSKPRSS